MKRSEEVNVRVMQGCKALAAFQAGCRRRRASQGTDAREDEHEHEHERGHERGSKHRNVEKDVGSHFGAEKDLSQM